MSKMKVVWITGASSGIGEALAKEYSNKGYYVVLSARNVTELERVQTSLANPVHSRIVPLDVGKYHELENLVAPALKDLGKIDVLINNAGISQRSDVLNTSLDVYAKILDVNVMGCIAMAKAVLPMMYHQGFGNICVISSVMGKASTPSRSGYCASKHALHGFFESLRAEAAPEGVHVTMVIPGYIRTNVSKNAVIADGSKHGKMDEVQDAGLAPEKLAKKIFIATERNKAEITVGGKEVYAISLFKFFPSLFRKMVVNFKPK